VSARICLCATTKVAYQHANEPVWQKPGEAPHDVFIYDDPHIEGRSSTPAFWQPPYCWCCMVYPPSTICDHLLLVASIQGMFLRQAMYA
jgi:hypothetical protein